MEITQGSGDLSGHSTGIAQVYLLVCKFTNHIVARSNNNTPPPLFHGPPNPPRLLTTLKGYLVLDTPNTNAHTKFQYPFEGK